MQKKNRNNLFLKLTFVLLFVLLATTLFVKKALATDYCEWKTCKVSTTTWNTSDCWEFCHTSWPCDICLSEWGDNCEWKLKTCHEGVAKTTYWRGKCTGNCAGGGGGKPPDTTKPMCGVKIQPYTASGNMVQNSDFETGNLSGWSVVSGGPEVRKGSSIWGWDYEPDYVVLGSQYEVEQTFNVEVGGIYSVSFWAKAQRYPGSCYGTGCVCWGISQVMNDTIPWINDPTAITLMKGNYDPNWLQFNSTFRAQDNQMTIRLKASRAGDECWYDRVAFDDVVVQKLEGAASASSSNVNLKIGFWDNRGLSAYRIKNSDNPVFPDEWSGMPPSDHENTCEFFANPIPWTLSSSGRVDVQVKDSSGNDSDVCSDSIYVPPPTGTITGNVYQSPDGTCSGTFPPGTNDWVVNCQRLSDPLNNLVQNGSFENGTTDWSLEGAGTKQIVSDAVYGSNAIYVRGDGGWTRVIQWVPIANNTTYTVSLTSKKTGGVVAADEWCLNPNAYQQGIWFPSHSTYQRDKWTFTSKTCAGDHGLAIYFDAYNSSQEIWVDGVLLEQGSTAGLWTDIQRAYFGLAPCGATGEAYCGNFEQNLSHYFGAVYYPSSDSVRVAQISNTPSCSGYNSTLCPWVTVSSFPVSNKDGTVKLTGVRPTVDSFNNLRIEWDLVFDGLPLATYNLYGMVVDNAGAWQNPSGPQWDDKGNITLQECITDPWFQTQGGDVHGQTGIHSKIPTTATNTNFCMDLDNYPGVVSYEGSADFGEGEVSSQGWLAKTSFSKKSYNYFYSLLGSPTPETPPPGGSIPLPDNDGVVVYNDNIKTAGNWNVGTKKIVILTEKRFLIQHRITVDNGGSLVVIAKEGIGVFKNIGDADPVQGIFITDGTFYSSVEEDFTPVESNRQLVIDGEVIAGQVDLKRDLETDNSTIPAEQFVFRPDFLLNSYQDLWKSSFTWEELAP